MFLTETYFHGELELPIRWYKSPSAVGISKILETVNEANLNWYITRYESECLRHMLGRKLYEAFYEGIKAEIPLSIWDNLKNAIYRQQDGYFFSPTANYVWFFVVRFENSKTTMKGEVKNGQTYASNISPIEKLCKVWNDMLPQIYEIQNYVLRNWGEYKNYADRTCLCNCYFAPINSFDI